MTRWLRPYEQPGLEEMLNEPIVKFVMASDGVARAEIVMLLERRRLTQTPCRPVPISIAGAAFPQAARLPTAARR